MSGIRVMLCGISFKLFELPKFIPTFARFSAESVLFYRKSLRQGTVNNV